jgi:hypothetical protein
VSKLHVTTKAHQWMDKVVTKDQIAVDGTAGNGNDTLKLSTLAKQVFAFDIQEIAVIKTRIRTQDQTNVSVILGSHEHIYRYVPTFNVLVFNLGYLPNSESTLATHAQTTIKALEINLPYLTKKGHLLITFYRRHPGGNEEYEAVSAYLGSNNDLVCLDRYTYDEELAPVFQIYQKR